MQRNLRVVSHMQRLAVLVITILVVCVIWSCSEKATSPDGERCRASLYQVPGCQRGSLGKSFMTDSCFWYQFNTALLVEFCVSANCCPDSNRFGLTYNISSDTISIAVVDTAANLCRCMCRYVIHGELDDLILNRYIVVCQYHDKILYLNEVHRKTPTKT
jgi:hypothetical protein